MGDRYDHRLRNAIVRSGDPNLFSELDIPASTIRDWFQKGTVEVITAPQFELSAEELICENQRLKKALDRAEAKSALKPKSVTIIGFEIQYRRLPNAEIKERLIDVLQNAAKLMSLSECLESFKLSTARFRAWIKRQKECQLEDHASCPKLTPTQHLPDEVGKIKEFVTSIIFPATFWHGPFPALVAVHIQGSYYFKLSRKLEYSAFPIYPKSWSIAAGENVNAEVDSLIVDGIRFSEHRTRPKSSKKCLSVPGATEFASAAGYYAIPALSRISHTIIGKSNYRIIAGGMYPSLYNCRPPKVTMFG